MSLLRKDYAEIILSPFISVDANPTNFITTSWHFKRGQLYTVFLIENMKYNSIEAVTNLVSLIFLEIKSFEWAINF